MGWKTWKFFYRELIVERGPCLYAIEDTTTKGRMYKKAEEIGQKIKKS